MKSFAQGSVKRVLCGVVGISLAAAACLHGQTDSQHSSDGGSNLFAEVFAFASDQPGKGRVDIFIQVPYPEISFVKEERPVHGAL